MANLETFSYSNFFSYFSNYGYTDTLFFFSSICKKDGRTAYYEFLDGFLFYAKSSIALGIFVAFIYRIHFYFVLTKMLPAASIAIGNEFISSLNKKLILFKQYFWRNIKCDESIKYWLFEICRRKSEYYDTNICINIWLIFSLVDISKICYSYYFLVFYLRYFDSYNKKRIKHQIRKILQTTRIKLWLLGRSTK